MLTSTQHAARSLGLGGSDIAAALGMNPRKTPVHLWMEKTGEIEPENLDDNDAVYWGNVLEDVVAKEYARRTERKLRRITKTLQHPEHSWMIAHIDRDILGERGGLEIKTAGAFASRDEWGDEGSDEVPLPYIIQCAAYMAVRDAQWWDLAVLRGGQQFAIYTINRDYELEDEIIRKAAEFWQHVQGRTPPPPLTAEDIALLYPRDDGTAVAATDEIAAAHHELCSIRAAIKEMNDRKTALEFELKTAMAPHTTLLGPGGKPLATWKAQTARRFDQKRFSADYPEFIEEYKTESESRVFRVKEVK